MIPACLAPVAFGFVLPRPMSFLVSGIATFRHAVLADGFVPLWPSSWPAAFPVVLVVAPVARKVVRRLVLA